MSQGNHDSPETVEDLLDTLSREQLQEFLAEECERRPETRDRLFARFGETVGQSD